MPLFSRSTPQPEDGVASKKLIKKLNRVPPSSRLGPKRDSYLKERYFEKVNASLGEHLTLPVDSLEPQGLRNLTKALETNTTLKSLHLKEIALKSDNLDAFGEALNKNATLEHLTFHKCQMLDGMNSEGFLSSLKNNNTLMILDLYRSQLREGDDAAIAAVVRRPRASGREPIEVLSNTDGQNIVRTLDRRAYEEASQQESNRLVEALREAETPLPYSPQRGPAPPYSPEDEQRREQRNTAQHIDQPPGYTPEDEQRREQIFAAPAPFDEGERAAQTPPANQQPAAAQLTNQAIAAQGQETGTPQTTPRNPQPPSASRG